jgi:methyl coenzyme M reductase subunit D
MIETNKVEPTRVAVALGYTVNMGNYESLRVDITVEDSARAGETAKALTDRVYAFTEAELIARVSAVRAGMDDDAK